MLRACLEVPIHFGIAQRIDELLDRIGFESAAKALPHELSSGETQRVAIARAIAHYPKMVLAGEPTANLDTATGQQAMQLIYDMGRDHGCTFITATHDTEISGIADSVTILRDGRIDKEGR